MTINETFKDHHRMLVMNTGGQTYIGYVSNHVSASLVGFGAIPPRVVTMTKVWQIVMMQNANPHTGQVKITPAPMPIHKAQGGLPSFNVETTGASWYFVDEESPDGEAEWEAAFKKIEDMLLKMRAQKEGIHIVGANEMPKD